MNDGKLKFALLEQSHKGMGAITKDFDIIQRIVRDLQECKISYWLDGKGHLIKYSQGIYEQTPVVPFEKAHIWATAVTSLKMETEALISMPRLKAKADGSPLE